MIYLSRYLVFLFLLQMTAAKAQNIAYSPDIPVEQHRIVIDHALGGTVSEWIDDLSYIPLEVENKSDIFQSVYRTGIIGNSIGILPNDGKKFYIYSTEGRLIKMIDINKIARPPHSEGVQDMKVWNDYFVLSTMNYKIKMDNKGENIVLLKEKQRYGSDSIQIGEAVWKYTRYDSLDNPNVALTMNGSPIIKYRETRKKYFFDKDAYFSPVSIPHGLSYFLLDSHYKIFELDELKVNRIYDFIFPQHNIVDTSVVYRSHSDFANKVIQQENKIHAFDRIIRYGDYLIFKAGHYRFYGFNIVTKDFIGFSDIVPDKSNDYMEVFSHFPVLTDNEYLYTFMASYSVQHAMETCEEESHTMRAAYKDLLKQYNLILVRFKLKS